MLILYSLMIPFLVVTGGGDQARDREDELTAVTLNCSGGLLGAIHRKSNNYFEIVNAML